MGPGTILVAAVAFGVIVLISKSIRVVQQAQTMIVERLGKYHKTLSSGINFVLPPGQPISGTVTNAAGGAPLSGVFINLANASGTFVGGASTDAAGHFTTGAVPAGTYYVSTFANGFVSQLYDHLSCATCPATNGTPVLVSNQPVTNINFQLLANGTGSLTGTVTDGFNNTLPTGVPMQLVNGSGQVIASTNTSNGVYTFSNVPTSSYYVRTNAPASGIPYINQLYNGVNCLNACSIFCPVRLNPRYRDAVVIASSRSHRLGPAASRELKSHATL